MVHSTAQAVEQTDNRIEVRVADVVVGRSEDRPVAVRIVGLLHLGGDVIERFIPANALPLVLAAHLAVRILRTPTLALHRVLDARRRGDVADLGASARTGSTLRHLDGVLVLFVGSNLERHAVLNVHFE